MTKRPLFLAAAVVIAVLSSPASAQTYIGVSSGGTLPQKSKNKGVFTSTVPARTAAPVYPAIPADTSLAWTTKFDRGYNISGQIGRRMSSGLRVEAEFNYNRAGVKNHRNVAAGGAIIDGVDASVLTRGATLGATVGAVVNSGIGKQESYGGFANAYYDLNADEKFQPYVGGGIGLQRVKFDYRPSNVDVGQGSGTNFAWQAMAGATYKVSPRFEVYGQYNYRDSGSTKMKLDLLPADLNAKSRQSIMSIGVRIPFGGAE